MKRPQAPKRRAKALGGAARIRYEALSKDFEHEQKQLGRYVAYYELAHLLRFFRRRVVETSSVVQYALHRQGQGAAIPAINRELKTLGGVLRLAQRNGKSNLVDIPLLQDDSPQPNSAPRPMPGSVSFFGWPAGHLPRQVIRQKVSGGSGRRPGLRDEEFLAHYKDHKPKPEWIGSDQQRAIMLSALPPGGLGRPISHDQVKRARFRTGTPPATRNAK